MRITLTEHLDELNSYYNSNDSYQNINASDELYGDEFFDDEFYGDVRDSDFYKTESLDDDDMDLYDESLGDDDIDLYDEFINDNDMDLYDEFIGYDRRKKYIEQEMKEKRPNYSMLVDEKLEEINKMSNVIKHLLRTFTNINFNLDDLDLNYFTKEEFEDAFWDYFYLLHSGNRQKSTIEELRKILQKKVPLFINLDSLFPLYIYIRNINDKKSFNCTLNCSKEENNIIKMSVFDDKFTIEQNRIDIDLDRINIDNFSRFKSYDKERHEEEEMSMPYGNITINQKSNKLSLSGTYFYNKYINSKASTLYDAHLIELPKYKEINKILLDLKSELSGDAVMQQDQLLAKIVCIEGGNDAKLSPYKIAPYIYFEGDFSIELSPNMVAMSLMLDNFYRIIDYYDFYYYEYIEEIHKKYFELLSNVSLELEKINVEKTNNLLKRVKKPESQNRYTSYF